MTDELDRESKDTQIAVLKAQNAQLKRLPVLVALEHTCSLMEHHAQHFASLQSMPHAVSPAGDARTTAIVQDLGSLLTASRIVSLRLRVVLERLRASGADGAVRHGLDELAQLCDGLAHVEDPASAERLLGVYQRRMIKRLREDA